MQIKDLPASSVLNADDVLAKETNGVATEKITGANLAAAVKLLASLLGVSDVVNSLISTSTTAPLAAAQGKALDEHIGVVQNGLTTIEINGNSTTHTGGAAVGEYVIVRNSTISGITDGLYKATQAIPPNTAITSAYLTAVDGGGLNALSSHIMTFAMISGTTNNNTTVEKKIAAYPSGFTFDNCFIISMSLYYSGNSSKYGLDSRVQVMKKSDGVYVYVSEAAFQSRDIHVLLGKVDNISDAF